MLEKPSTKVGVRTMRDSIAVLAGPRKWGDTRESWLSHAAQRAAEYGANVPYRTVKSLFYGEIADDNHWAAIELRRAAAIIEAQQQAANLAAQFETIISGLVVADEEFHQPTIAALRSAISKMRGENIT